MVKKNEVELWSTIKERLSPPDLKTFLSLSRDFNHRRIEKTQLIESALLLFKNDEFLCRCFTDFLQEDGDGETRNDEGEVREADSETEACVRNTESTTNIKVEEATAKNEVESWSTIKERLSPQDLKTLISMGNDFNDRRIGYTQLNASALLLFKNDEFLYRCFTDLLQEDEDGETQNDEGEVRETEACVRNTEPTRNTKESERKVEEATAKNEVESWSTIKERLSPQDLKTLISMGNDFNDRRIGYTQLNASALLLFKNDEFLYRCFTDLLQEDEDGETQNDEGEVRETEACVRNTEPTRNTKESERKVEEATAKNEVESWSTIKERLSPQDLKTLISMGNDFNDRRIGYTQLNASALLLFKNDEFLYRCFTDLLQEDEDGETQNDEGEVRETEACVRNTEPTRNTKESERKVEEATAMAYDVDQEDVAICEIIDKLFSENLICRSELQKLISLVQDKQKISHSEFRESLLLLLEDTFQDQDEQYVKAKQDVEDTVLEEGEIREDRLLLRDTKVEQVVNPSYTLIPEEERSPVSATVLNNEYRQVKVVTPRPEKLTGYRKQAAEYEDDMYREDMVIGDLASAVELWEKVMKREVRIEDVEEKFYTCIRELDRGALVKKLRQNYQVALPRILDRLKEKLSNLRLTQATKKSRWKQIESNARRRRKNSEGKQQFESDLDGEM